MGFILAATIFALGIVRSNVETLLDRTSDELAETADRVVAITSSRGVHVALARASEQQWPIWAWQEVATRTPLARYALTRLMRSYTALERRASNLFEAPAGHPIDAADLKGQAEALERQAREAHAEARMPADEVDRAGGTEVERLYEEARRLRRAATRLRDDARGLRERAAVEATVLHRRMDVLKTLIDRTVRGPGEDTEAARMVTRITWSKPETWQAVTALRAVDSAYMAGASLVLVLLFLYTAGIAYSGWWFAWPPEPTWWGPAAILLASVVYVWLNGTTLASLVDQFVDTIGATPTALLYKAESHVPESASPDRLKDEIGRNLLWASLRRDERPDPTARKQHTGSDFYWSDALAVMEALEQRYPGLAWVLSQGNRDPFAELALVRVRQLDAAVSGDPRRLAGARRLVERAVSLLVNTPPVDRRRAPWPSLPTRVIGFCRLHPSRPTPWRTSSV